MKTIKLTQQVSATVKDNKTVLIDTQMKTGGGGGRNLIVWSLLASKKGYTNITIVSRKDASPDAKESLIKAVNYANELLNHLGVKVHLL